MVGEIKEICLVLATDLTFLVPTLIFSFHLSKNVGAKLEYEKRWYENKYLVVHNFYKAVVCFEVLVLF